VCHFLGNNGKWVYSGLGLLPSLISSDQRSSSSGGGVGLPLPFPIVVIAYHLIALYAIT